MRERHYIVTITGPDRCGKATQAALLEQVMKPSRRLSFPDYNHWAGRIVRAILREEPFYLLSKNEFERVVDNIDNHGAPYRSKQAAIGTIVFRRYLCQKHPIIFQILQSIDRLAWQEEIVRGLEHHHWVMDRYEVDALAYGIVDGCPSDWLWATNRLFRPSDLVIVLAGKPIPRSGETADLNERSEEFQQKVLQAYRQLRYMIGQDRVAILEIDRFQEEEGSEPRSIARVHQKVVEIVRKYLGLDLKPLSEEQIAVQWNTEHRKLQCLV